jgi:exopolysaccharide biosynthesis polyprenyl glycosylphosphotransferase
VVDPDTVSVKPDGDLVTLDLAGAHVHAQALDSYEAAVHGARFWSRIRVGVDVTLLVLAAAIADLWGRGTVSVETGLLWPAVFVLIVVVMSYVRGAYRRRTKIETLDDVRSTGWVLAVATSLVVTLSVLVDDAPDIAARQTVRLGLCAALLVAGGRIVVNIWQVRTRQQGKALVPTLIVGAGHIGRMTAKRLLEHPDLGLRPIGFLDKEPLVLENSPLRVPVLGASWDFDRIVAEHDVGQVIVTFSTAPNEVLLRIVNRCQELGIDVSLVPRLFEKVTERLSIEHLGGLPLITSHPSNPRGWQFAVKYALDKLCALGILLILSPVMIACAIAVAISLGRPVLFRQRRVGYDGREFEMLKFRSLRPGGLFPDRPDELPDDTAPGGFGNEDRITRVGSFLRNSSLDELPQLLNVLKGEMSLVGPRPERPEFVELFEPRIHRYDDRHRVRAGITGWAQINGLRGQTSLSDRVEWDNYYIENFSLWLDLKIIGRTIITLPRHSKVDR